MAKDKLLDQTQQKINAEEESVKSSMVSTLEASPEQRGQLKSENPAEGSQNLKVS
jgi:hypothetical protein